MPERDAQTLTGGLENTPPPGETLTGGLEDGYSSAAPDKAGGENAGTGGDWSIGEVIAGKYEVLELLGQRAMGTVHKVRHREWELDLAVKMPRAALVTNQDLKARFIQEAQTWMDLGLHPNIVQYWYVRELDGIPLTGGVRGG